MKKNWKMSATFIGAFKSCAYRCYLKYVLGLVPEEKTDSLRVGSNWHRVLEIMKMTPGAACPECYGKRLEEGHECPLCSGTNILPDQMIDAVVCHLNAAYANVPLSKTKEEWLTERAILLNSAVGYDWFYANDDYEVVAEEVRFRIPVRNPKTGRALPNVVLDGMIDKIVKSPTGVYYIDEHKSTSKDVAPDSLYWKHLNLDTQTLLYPYAAQQLQLAGKLEKYGIKASDPLISGVRYDAWHKPGIRPKMLTQGESKKFLETGDYMGNKFEVTGVPGSPETDPVYVDGEETEVKDGAKEGTFAIRETSEMFGARLLVDIGERPEYYFHRKPIERTTVDLEKFEREILSIYHTVKFIDKNDCWWKNENQCEATFRCSYLDICYNNVDLTDGHVPNGLKLTGWAKKEREENARDAGSC